MSKELTNQRGKGKGKLSKRLGGLSKDLGAELGKLELPRAFYQLVLFVIDASRSMENRTPSGSSKAEEVNNSIWAVLKRLQESRNTNSFDIGYIAFSDEYDDSFGLKQIKDIPAEWDFNPLNQNTTLGGTKLLPALERAKEQVEEYLTEHQDRNAQAIIVILSDGVLDDYDEALEIAESLKGTGKTTLIAQYFERLVDDGTEFYLWDEQTGDLDLNKPVPTEEVRKRDRATAQLFKAFASTDELYITSTDPQLIRNHMIKSITAISKKV